MRTLPLGGSGPRVSRLAFGTGTSGWGGRSRQTSLGVDGLSRLLRLGLDLGVSFWDSADQYGSHPHVAAALRGIDRSSVVIATKTTATTAGDAEKAITRFLRELNTDYVDVVLLHGMHSGDWQSRLSGAVGALTRAKERGLVRAVGVSSHSTSVLEAAAADPWIDVVLARINHAGVNMDDQPSRVVPLLDGLHAAGKGVYAMKVIGQGALAGDVRTAIRFVAGLTSVDALSIGMVDERMLRQNVELVEQFDAEATLMRTTDRHSRSGGNI